MRIRRVLEAVAVAVALTLLLAACGAGTATTDTDDGAADTSGAEESSGNAPSDTLSVEEVLAEIAAMDLTYEERLDYLRERAVEEGAVLHYGDMNLAVQEAWSEGFQEAYPEINHLYVRQRIGDLRERVLAEAQSGRHLVDVIQTSAVSGAVMYGEGLVAEHHGVPIPESYPDQYVEDWSVVVTLNPHVITWNTDVIAPEDAPREWDEFLEPEHAGCVFVDAQSFVAAMVAERGYDAAESWFQAFLDNDGIIRRGYSDTTRALAAGEFDCAVHLNAHSVEAMIVEDGAPLEWHAPDPTSASASSVYVYKHTERPHAAALLMHWILGEGGARVLADDGRIALHPGVPMRYERLQPWNEPGSDLERRLLPLRSEVAMDVDDDALDLIERYVLPNLIQD